MTHQEHITVSSKPGLKRYLPLVVVVLFALPVSYFKLVHPSPDIRPPAPPPRLVVETEVITPRDITVKIKSYGTVTARTQATLSAQVSGKIVSVSPAFQNGAFFNQGDILLTLEQGDYLANVDIAKATLLDATQALETEKAESAQALKNWRISGNSGTPSDLVLRKPQLKAAEAKLLAAQAELAKANLNLERTVIRAPYNGRLLDKLVGLGQTVAVNTAIADIYATDVAEVRLPVRNSDLPYLKLPQQHADSTQETTGYPLVLITSGLNKQDQWLARLVRTEGQIDAASRQLHVVAEVQKPFQPTSNEINLAGKPYAVSASSAINIGQYVTAEIYGNALTGVIVIPSVAIYQGRYVYVVENGLLQRKIVNVSWQTEDLALVDTGLKAGDQLVLTPLGQVTSGTPVEIIAARQN